MGPGLFARPFAWALSVALAFALAPASVAQQTAQGHAISFKEEMRPSPEWEITHYIYAMVTKEMAVRPTTPIPKPDDPWADPPPVQTTTITQRVDILRVPSGRWWSPLDLSVPRAITEQEALASGAAQVDIDRAKNTPKAIDIAFYEMFYLSGGAGTDTPIVEVRENDRAQGDVIVNATLPPHPGGRWVLKAVSALGEERVYPIQLGAGGHSIAITGIEAGNVLVTLFATDADGNRSTYFQEAVALVRKYGATGAPGGDDIATLDMRFAEPGSPDRYRLGYLGAGNCSQSDRANLPLQQDREAMIRAMAYDAWGNGGSPITRVFDAQGNGGAVTLPSYRLDMAWSSTGGSGSKTFATDMSGRHARSGLIFNSSEADASRNEHVGLGPKIPGEHVRPGLELAVRLFSPDGLPLADKGVGLEVVKPRKITIFGYDVTKAANDDWSYGDTTNDANAGRIAIMLTNIYDIFPYAKVNYCYGGRIFAPCAANLMGAHSAVLAKAGWQTVDLQAEEVELYLGFTNIMDPDWAGMASWTSMVVAGKVQGGQDSDPGVLGVVVAHEMGHCFGLKHAPGWGASDPDHNYPYGGGGLAGGWGYSIHLGLFFAEDDHAPDKPFPTAYWDTMSYGFNLAHFSDYNVAKLVPGNLTPTAPPQVASELPGVWTYPGTQTRIFGPEAARAAEAAWEQGMGVGSAQGGPQQTESGNSIDPGLGDEEPPGDIGTIEMPEGDMYGEDEGQQGGGFDLDAYMQGQIANNGRLPDMVYTALPIFKGIEPYMCR